MKTKIFLLFILVSVFSTELFSQSINNYTVSRNTGISYTSISSTGTSVPTWRNTGQYSQDDNRSIFIDIGFDYWYNGVRYTKFSISTNGFIDFSSSTANGTGTGAYGYQNTRFSNTTPTGLSLAPMYDDLTAQGGVEALGNSIKYQTTGSSPNRVLTVEWVNLAVYNNTTPSINFQVKLYETTGVIEFVYGTMTAGTASYSYSSGINAGTISNPPTSAQLKTQQSANSSTFSNTAQNNLSTLPASNSRITFTPPTHTGTFNGTLSFSGVSNSAMTVNYNNWCTNEVGYAIYVSTDNTNFTYVTQNAANSTSYSATGLDPSTTYYWRVYAVTEGRLSTAATGNRTTNAAGNKVSTGTGSWNTSGSWSPSGVPSATDNVTIRNGHTITINTNANCNNLTVGEGTSGTLTFDGTSRTLTVNGNVTVNSGATLITSNTNDIHNMIVDGNISNSGTFNLRRSGSRYTNISFNRNGNQTVSGNGNYTFANITQNMGTSKTNILEFTANDISFQNNSVTITNGTFKLSGTSTQTLNFYTGDATLGTSTGFHLNNANAAITFQGDLNLGGDLIVENGTLNIGDAANEYLLSTGGFVEVRGGALNVAGQYYSSNINTISNFTISGGTFTVPTQSSSSTTIYPFQINANGSTFNMSGGTIVIQREGGGGSEDLGMLIEGLASNEISDGTIQFGNASTPAGQTMILSTTSDVPRLVLFNANANVRLASAINVLGDIDITGANLNTNNNNVVIEGNWISSGTYTAGTNTTLFDGTGDQTITNTSGETFNHLEVLKTNGNLVLNNNVSCNNLILTSNDISINGQTLTVAGNLSGSGKIRGSNTSNLSLTGTGSIGTLNMSSASQLTKRLNNLTIELESGSVTIGSDSLFMKNTLDIVSGTLVSNGRLTLISDATNTARIADLTNGTITGNITAQRFIPGGVNKRKWRFMSNPVNVSGGIALTQYIDDMWLTGPGGATNGFDNSPNNASSFRTYNEAAAGAAGTGWVSAPNINTVINTGVGFEVFVRGSRETQNPFELSTVPLDATLDLTGQVNKGTFVHNLSYTNNSTPTADGFNLIGNPFPSQVDLMNTNMLNANNLTTVWAYNPNTGGYGVFDLSLGVGTNQSSRYIPLGQAVFVKATGAGQTFTFFESAKVSNTPFNFFRSKMDKENLLKFTVHRDTALYDDLIIYFKEGTSKSDSDQNDANKLFNDELNFYSKSSNNTNLSINYHPLPGNNDSIKLSLFSTKSGNLAIGTYTMEFDGATNVNDSIEMYLYDRYTKAHTDIRANNYYTFEINSDSSSWGNERFVLLLNKKLVGIDTKANRIGFSNVYPNPANEYVNISINFPSTYKSSKHVLNYKMFDMSGRLILQSDIKGMNSIYPINISSLDNGIYFLHINSELGTSVHKIIKR